MTAAVKRCTQVIVGDLPRINSERRPAGVAYIHGGLSWTWSEIDARVNRMGRFLTEDLGLADGAVVGMLADNRVECLELMFAASRARLIHTAIKSRGHTKEKLRQALDAGLDALLVGPGFEAEARQIQAELPELKLVGVGGAEIGRPLVLDGAVPVEPIPSHSRGCLRRETPVGPG